VTPDHQISAAERIASQLRSSIRKARSPRSGNPAVAKMAEPEGALDFDLALLRSNYDVATPPFRSHRKLLGRPIIFLKNFALELLIQLLVRQTAYNGAASRLITHLRHQLDRMAEENGHLAQRLAVLEARLASQSQDSKSFETETLSVSDATGGGIDQHGSRGNDAGENGGVGARSTPRLEKRR